MKKAVLLSLLLIIGGSVFAQDMGDMKPDMKMTHKEMGPLEEPPRKLARKLAKLNKGALQVSKSIIIPAAKKDVFALVSDHENLPKMLPMIHDVKVDQSNAEVNNGVGCVRTCTMADGSALSEEIVFWQPGKAYAYAISDDNMMGLQKHLGVFAVAKEGGKTRLSWYTYFNHDNAEMVLPQLNQLMDMMLMKIQGHFTGEVAGR